MGGENFRDVCDTLLNLNFEELKANMVAKSSTSSKVASLYLSTEILHERRFFKKNPCNAPPLRHTHFNL